MMYTIQWGDDQVNMVPGVVFTSLLFIQTDSLRPLYYGTIPWRTRLLACSTVRHEFFE